HRGLHNIADGRRHTPSGAGHAAHLRHGRGRRCAMSALPPWLAVVIVFGGLALRLFLALSREAVPVVHARAPERDPAASRSWPVSVIFGIGLLFMYIGERIVESGSSRAILSGLGAVVVLFSTGLRFVRSRQ